MPAAVQMLQQGCQGVGRHRVGRRGSRIRPTPANAFPCFHAAPKLLKASIGRRGGHPSGLGPPFCNALFFFPHQTIRGVRFRPVPSPCGRPAAPGWQRCWPERLDRGLDPDREKTLAGRPNTRSRRSQPPPSCRPSGTCPHQAGR